MSRSMSIDNPKVNLTNDFDVDLIGRDQDGFDV